MILMLIVSRADDDGSRSHNNIVKVILKTSIETHNPHCFKLRLLYGLITETNIKGLPLKYR